METVLLSQPSTDRDR